MKKFLSRVRRFVWKAFLWFVAVSVLWVLAYRFINPPTTILQLLQGKEESSEWVSIEEMGTALPLAVVASEDQRFFKHHGFDRAAIEAAFAHNQKNSNKRGASTISQQTAKNVFLWPSRSWLRKGLEAYFTLLIEVFWPKERILEVYLNVIEMGPQCFGADAASRRYFKKAPKDLRRSQAALIAGALPSPRKMNPGAPSAYLSGRGKAIEKQMRLLGGSSYLPWTQEKEKK